MSFKPVFLLNAAIAEPAGTTATEQAPSVASLLATQGKILTNENDTPPEAVINTEQKEEPKQAEVPNAASAKEPSSAVQVISETQEPVVTEPVAATTAPIVQEPAPVQTWQEVLKAQQPETVFKELGYDEKVVNISKALSESPQMAALFDQWINKGDITPYLKAVSTDYAKMDSEQLMRHQLLDEYPDADEATINALYQRKVVRAYDLDSTYSDELAEGKLLLDAEAKKVRESLISKQQQFLTPKPPEPKADAAPVETPEQAQQKRIDFIVNSTKESPTVQDFIKNQQLVVGEGDEAYPYPVPEPQKVIDLLITPGALESKLWTKQDLGNGQEKLTATPLQILLGAIAHDPKDFFTKYSNHLKSLGSKAIIDPIENASAPSNATSSAAEQAQSVAAQMAKGGRIVS